MNATPWPLPDPDADWPLPVWPFPAEPMTAEQYAAERAGDEKHEPQQFDSDGTFCEDCE